MLYCIDVCMYPIKISSQAISCTARNLKQEKGVDLRYPSESDHSKSMRFMTDVKRLRVGRKGRLY
jgi:hypothetical protein